MPLPARGTTSGMLIPRLSRPSSGGQPFAMRTNHLCIGQRHARQEDRRPSGRVRGKARHGADTTGTFGSLCSQAGTPTLGGTDAHRDPLPGRDRHRAGHHARHLPPRERNPPHR